jgi:putative ABC transport system permease protein
MSRAERDITEIIKSRHFGKDDVTVMNQGAILNTFNSIFLVLTSTLAGIAAISLAVAGTLIMNVMLVAVSQRTGEIGLLKALGAQRRQVVSLFLLEAAMLSLMGAVLGFFLGQGAISLLRELYPAVEFRAPDWAVVAAMVMAVGSGLLFGIMPARRAARLDPIVALAGH